jgi:hypothetical protein
MGEAQGKALSVQEGGVRAPTATPQLRAMRPTVLPSPLSLDGRGGSGHTSDRDDFSFSDWIFTPDSPVLSSELGMKAARAVFCMGQPHLRAEPGSLHPRNSFMPAARIPSHDIVAVDWSQAGVPFPIAPRRDTTRGTAVPVTTHLCKPAAHAWKVKSSRQATAQHLSVTNHRMRRTRHLQQPMARGFKRTP